jgi:hypothetical protein
LRLPMCLLRTPLGLEAKTQRPRHGCTRDQRRRVLVFIRKKNRLLACWYGHSPRRRKLLRSLLDHESVLLAAESNGADDGSPDADSTRPSGFLIHKREINCALCARWMRRGASIGDALSGLSRDKLAQKCALTRIR